MNEINSPKISVIVLSYNFGKYIGECIESIVNQTLRPYKIIIADDCSSDNSWEVIKKYESQYPEIIKAFRHHKNMGVVYNSTFAKKNAMIDSEYVSTIDGDDRWLSRKLEMEYAALKSNPNAGLAYSGYNFIDEQGKILLTYKHKCKELSSQDILVKTLSRTLFNGQGIFRNPLYKISTFENMGFSDDKLESWWDWDNAIRCCEKYIIAYSGDVYVEYRLNPTGMHTLDPIINYRTVKKIYEKYMYLIENNSNKDKIYIKCHIEKIILALQCKYYPNNQEVCYSAKKVYERNKKDYDKLSNEDKAIIKADIYRLFAILNKIDGLQKMKNNEIGKAIKSLCMFAYYKAILLASEIRREINDKK